MKNYSKPEVRTLGDAAEVIQVVGKGGPIDNDGALPHFDPAYDLDE